MTAAYIYCHYCGTEEQNVEVQLGGNYSNGRFVVCNYCEEETQDFEFAQTEETEKEL